MSAPAGSRFDVQDSGPRRSLLRPLLIGGFAITVAIGLAAGVWWWLHRQSPAVARVSVMIAIDPAPATLVLNGEEMRAGVPLQLAPGEYALEAAVPGYTLLNTKFRVAAGMDAPLAFKLDPLPGLLSVTTEPAALVTLNGQDRGLTPLENLELPPGEYTLRLDAGEDFGPKEQKIAIAGRREHVAVAVVLERSWSWVTIETEPIGVRIRDAARQLVGLSGRQVKVYAGKHTWLLEAGDGWVPAKVEFDVVANRDLVLSPHQFVLIPGVVEVNSEPPGHTVMLDGRSTGRKTPAKFELPPGTPVHVQVLSPGHEPWNAAIHPESGKTAIIQAQLEPYRGRLEITSLPNRSEVYRQDALVGQTPLTMELPVGEIEITVRRVGFEDATIRVGVVRDEQVSREIILRKKVQ